VVKIVLCWCFGYEISNNNSLLTHVGRLAAIPGDRGVNGIVSVFFNVQSAYKYHKLWGGGAIPSSTTDSQTLIAS